MYQALYREYRPEVFEDVLGQEHIIRILKNQIDRNETGHAYLFCGTRGTGKTTVARLLAKALNCTGAGRRPCGECENCRSVQRGNFLDVIELDAASNNGVDQIRDLRETVNYPPVIGRKKVYIIDEVHMLSNSAANALLKTLEEPPDYCVFILATTDPQRLPATVLSRCLRMDFHRVPDKALKGRLELICREKNIEAEESALDLILSNSDGSARDALSLLDQCLAGADKRLLRDDVVEMLGVPTDDMLIGLTDAAAGGDVSDIILTIDEIISSGKDVNQLAREWLSHYRDLLIAKYVKRPENILSRSPENAEKLKDQAAKLDNGYISGAIRRLSAAVSEMRYSTQPRILLEMAALNIGAIEESEGKIRKKRGPVAAGDLWQRIMEQVEKEADTADAIMLRSGIGKVEIREDKLVIGETNGTKTGLIDKHSDVILKAAAAVAGRKIGQIVYDDETKISGKELERNFKAEKDG